MTAISPLQSIHKKGVFGDHHKKNEIDLLNISELKDLTIIQVVQYKKSEVQIESINIEGLNFPLKNSQVSANKDLRILWSAPRTWLFISEKNIIKKINEKCDFENFAITEISHSRAIIQIKGIQAKEVLKKGCPLNFNEFSKNKCAGSSFHGIAIVVDCIEDDPLTFNLITLRSFGDSFYHHITDASLEFGYVGV